MEFDLRRAGLADLAAIMELERGTFQTDAWSTESMSAELGSEHTWYVVAFDPERPDALAGYAGLLAPEGGREGDIQTIAVVPDARRRGLGRTLMETLIAEAEARHVREVFLEVRADNPVARGLYDSLGFELIGVRKKYYQPDGVDAEVMRLTLRRGDIADPAPGPTWSAE